MADFLEKLRINNIFPAGEGLYEDRKPFGMPEFKPVDDGSRVRSIGRRMGRTVSTRPTRGPINIPTAFERLEKRHPRMNVEYKDSYIGGAGSRIMQRSDERAAARNDPQFEQALELEKVKQSGKQRDLDIKQQRANVYEFRAKNPNMRILTPKGGNLTAVNPQTGETLDLGVPTGTMSESELQELRGEQTMEQIGARTEGQKEVQELRGEQQKDIRKSIGEQQLANIAARNVGRGQQPTQTRVEQTLAARQLANTNPQIAQHLQFNSDGTVSIVGNPDPVTMSQIQRGIYGVPGDIELPVAGTTTTPRGTTNVTLPPSKQSDPLGIR